MFEEMAEAFDLGKIDLATYSPLTLAYIGDCVYELIIRTRLVYAGNAPVDKLNRKASNLAKAGTQSAMIEALIPELTDEETAAYKNATAGDYRRATGFEALIGYLYLDKRFERIMELVKKGFEAVECNDSERK